MIVKGVICFRLFTAQQATEVSLLGQVPSERWIKQSCDESPLAHTLRWITITVKSSSLGWPARNDLASSMQAAVRDCGSRELFAQITFESRSTPYSVSNGSRDSVSPSVYSTKLSLGSSRDSLAEYCSRQKSPSGSPVASMLFTSPP